MSYPKAWSCAKRRVEVRAIPVSESRPLGTHCCDGLSFPRTGPSASRIGSAGWEHGRISGCALRSASKIAPIGFARYVRGHTAKALSHAIVITVIDQRFRQIKTTSIRIAPLRGPPSAIVCFHGSHGSILQQRGGFNAQMVRGLLFRRSHIAAFRVNGFASGAWAV